MTTEGFLASMDGRGSVLRAASDFSAAYMHVRGLRERAAADPGSLDPSAPGDLWRLLAGYAHQEQKNARLLFGETATVLSLLHQGSPDPLVRDQALELLIRATATLSGKPRMAAAEALGCLPLEFPRRPVPADSRVAAVDSAECPALSWAHLLGREGLCADTPVRVAGRTLLVRAGPGTRLLALKLARTPQEAVGLRREAFWLEEVAAMTREGEWPAMFRPPRPMPDLASGLLRPRDLPAEADGLATPCLALAYTAHPDYFAYPNDPSSRPGSEDFVEMMAANAWLAGRFAGRGILHTALIPLFHNRVQAVRRDDQGLYEWHRQGRLDRWLESCRYPNFGAAGLRDFEHLHVVSGPGRELFHALGSHFLSLLLVAGSWFRAADPGLAGRAGDRPADARHLFDAPLLALVVRRIFAGYHRGFTGADYQGPGFCDLERLALGMREAMGQDMHMIEVLRVRDQEAMSLEEYHGFLEDRGREAPHPPRGAADITLMTGPHLGGFNRPISLPEMIEFIAAAAGLCVAGQWRGRGGVESGSG